MADRTPPRREGPPEAEMAYEARDVHVSVIVKAGIAFVVLMAISGVIVYAVFWFLSGYETRRDRPVSPLASSRVVAPGPRLQVDPPQQKQQLDAYEQQVLTTYGWADRQQRLARVPVTRAMELLASGRFGLDLRPSTAP